MTSPRRFLTCAIAFCLLLGASAGARPKDPVRIGVGGSWPGYGIWYVIDARGLAPDLDLQLSILEDPRQVQSMLAAVSFDLVDSTFDYAPVAAELKLPIKLVAVHNLSHGGDQIIVAPGVLVPEGIKGQPFPASFGYLGQIVAAYWLQQIGLGVDNVTFLDLTVEQAAADMISGRAKVAYLYEPYAGEILRRLKGAKVAYSTADAQWMKNPMGGDAITMADSFIAKHRDVALKVLKAYFIGQAYWHAHPQESNAIIAKALRYSTADVAAVMGGGSATDGQILVEPFLFAARFCGVAPGIPLAGEQNGQIYPSLAEINKWRLKLGEMKTTVAPKDGVDCSLMADLVRTGFDPGSP
jgi:NitT/TauT family transport system substrate-binding protein